MDWVLENDGMVEKGNVFSKNITCQDIIIFLVDISRHRYPMWLEGYPKKTQAVERGASL